MIQDIAPHCFDNAYRPLPPDRNSRGLFYQDGKALIRLKEDGSFEFPRFRDLEADNGDIYRNYIYLFSIDGQAFYLLEHITIPAPSGFTMENTQFFRGASPRFLGFAGITGWQLAQWYASRRYCGQCGAPLVHDEKERMMRCPRCGHLEYPKISPAVIIAVTDGDRLLLSKYAGRTYKKYALLAGFTEIGETLEETVRREVMEEVGLRVDNIRYYKSQPWSFSGTLLAGFFCDLAEPGQIRLDEEELALAQWFDRKELPLEDPDHASLTHEMIRYFYENGRP
ncbi:MAG: NAD(+) diphosphatase [Eubacteriales bacterium]|nr:NAD(+) diphosphatase [Eubacteriales bacterium]